ncbi:hypothetical protein EV361DRAFT_675971 [Lentinula raphanica]|uniref:Uncharacterized protein n=1 Tax=Lentinula raphanica TaxID=153919 RepID=A0AA38P1C1_9AGAR|nr:hypothetical protein F5880DRAFT_1080158 [Lentinula raphanica]KAJ3834503.1 hypothetical protein F5878DRAFT_664708 [Lentinula raphanica]KAJ3974137.1 hypothetical protein EV361DRAFT_675971 [Lentinula raphanica]
MLARPRPPAQVRRASKETSTFSFPSQDDTSNLPQLLTRADGLIRERERELSFTSELSRELKQTHEALVARTPLTSPSSFHVTSLPQSPQSHSRNTSIISNFTNTSTLYQSLHALHSSQSQAISPNSSFGPPSPATSRHTRRISITQSELARLSDQNAELLQKLEQLEEDSTSADKAGRRRLGKLELEIQTLRDELDQARMNNANTEINSTSNKREKMQRRRKVDNEESSATFQDFAPSTSISSLSQSSASSSSTSSAEDSSSSTILDHLLSKISELEEANVQICREQRDTAARLRDAQSQVEDMRKVWSSLGVSSGIDDEEDDVDIQIVADHLQDLSVEEGDEQRQGTMRSLRSLRSVKLDFESGINGEMHSTLKLPSDMSGSSGYNFRANSFRSKGRSSVFGLFPGDEEERMTSSDISSDSLNLDATSPRTPPVHYSTLQRVMFSPTDELSELDLSVSLNHSRSQSFDADGVTSDDGGGTPLLRKLNGLQKRSLGSEIGDLDDADNYPLSGFSYLRSRNNSLMQEVEEYRVNSAPSQRDASSPLEDQGFPRDSGHFGSEEDSEDTQKYHSAYPASNASIRIIPPTPEHKNALHSHASSLFSSRTSSFYVNSERGIKTTATASVPQSPSESKSKSKLKADPESVRARRISLSQSVKARAGRWGPRLSDIFQVARGGSAKEQPGQDKPIDRASNQGHGGIREEIGARLSEGLGSAFGSRGDDDTRTSSSTGSQNSTISRQPSRHSSHSPRPSCSQIPVGAVTVRPVLATTSSSSVQRIRSLVLEAWLWLQLLVVLGVFVWAVARKGPRGVLMPTEVDIIEGTEDNSRSAIANNPNDGGDSDGRDTA